MSRRRFWQSLFCLVLLLASSTLVASCVRTTPAEAQATYNVLFDNAHAETAGNADWIISTSQPDPLAQNADPQTETDWTGGISAWGVTLQKTGRYHLKTNTSALTYGDSSNALDLSNFQVLVIPEPNALFTSSEKTAILNFVKNGGGLFMIADHNKSDRNNDGYDSLHIFNDLMNNNGVGNDVFGIQFDILSISNENPHNDIPNGHPVLNGPFGTASGTIIRSGTTETISTAHNANAHGIIYRNNVSNTGSAGVVLAGSIYGSGRVLAIGDSSAIDDGSCVSGNTCYDGWNDGAAQDNVLFPNGTEWLAGGPISDVTPTSTTTKIPTSTATTSNRILNGGFEQGRTSWIESSSGGNEIISSSKPHTGSSVAHFCGYNNCRETLYQRVVIPAMNTPVTLKYYWYMSTTENRHSYDYLSLRIRDSSGVVLATLQTISDGSRANNWQSASYNISAYKGQTIQVAFVATNGAKNPTDFYVDDVALTTG